MSKTKSLRLSMQNSEPVSNSHVVTEKYSSRDPELAGGGRLLDCYEKVDLNIFF